LSKFGIDEVAKNRLLNQLSAIDVFLTKCGAHWPMRHLDRDRAA
jgi:hypothetical protein